MSLQNYNIGRIKEVDGLRGAAILLIVMSHFESSFFPHKILCNDYSGCITSIERKILYNDSNHLSRHGSELMAPSILKLPVFNNENY